MVGIVSIWHGGLMSRVSIAPDISASYERKLANNSRQIVTELVTQPGVLIRTNIGSDEPDFVRLSTGLPAQFANNLAVGVGSERLCGSNASENNLNAQLRYQF